MINFDEELKKFKPSIEVKEAEDAIQSSDLTDIIDILKQMTINKRQARGERNL